MKSAKFFTIFSLLLTFVFQVSAQVNRYPNELKGYELMKNSRLNNLIPYVSTSEEVMKVYGKECKNTSHCEFNEDWNIGFFYVGSRNGKENPKITGRLDSIVFYPRKRISFSKVNFPNKFERGYGGQSHFNATLIFYKDDFGLMYVVIDKSNEYEFKDGDLLRIEYSISESKAEKY